MAKATPKCQQAYISLITCSTRSPGTAASTWKLKPMAICILMNTIPLRIPALPLGEVFAMALGNKRGIERYGFCLPMDDCLAQVAIDFGGRNWMVWEAEFKREKIGEMPTEMFFHFFKSFSDAAKCNLNIKAEGQNEHHKIEAIFKAFAKAIKMAVKRDVNNMVLPSTKGVL